MNNLMNSRGEPLFSNHLLFCKDLPELFLDFVNVFPSYEEVSETLDVFSEIIVRGRITDQLGSPVASALVEMWHPTQWGLYGMEYWPSYAPIDPDAQGWVCAVTNENGEYFFKTEKRTHQPGFPIPLIEIKVTNEFANTTLTRLYFGENQLEVADPFLMDMEIEKRCQYFGVEKEGVCEFNIVL